MNEIFDKIFTTAERLGVDICIAGGAAVNLDKASDIDVFVFNSGCLELAAALDPAYVPYEVMYEGSTFQVVATCNPLWSRLPIQITRRKDCADVEDLLNEFDLSIHQWAWTRDGLQTVPGSTKFTDPIRVHRMSSTTPARLVKLTQRYFPTAA